MTDLSVPELENLAAKIRRQVLEITAATKSAHLGSCFSCVDLLTSLYFKVLQHSPENINNKNRDRFILSKGHACLSLYVTLTERGFMPKDILDRYGINGGTLEHHSKRATKWGIEVSSGSLGHGLSLATGSAMAAKLDELSYRTYVVLSDGELNEGTIWEAALFAGHHNLNNLVAIVDYNKIQALGNVADILNPEPLAAKWEAFGWDTIEIDGHNIEQIVETLSTAKNSSSKKPLAVIAHTVKGKGVSFMENQLLWHYRCPAGEELEAARKELQNSEQGSL